MAGGSEGGGIDGSPWSFDRPGAMRWELIAAWRTTDDSIHCRDRLSIVVVACCGCCLLLLFYSGIGIQN